MSFLLKKIIITPILDPKQDIFRNFAAQNAQMRTTKGIIVKSK